MAKLKIVLDHPLEDGMSVTVKTACDCTAVDGLRVAYPVISESGSTSTYADFTFKDVHGNDLSGVGNLFTANAYVKFVLDTTNNFAYPQNADTNAYLENRFESLGTKEHTHNASDIIGGTFGGQVKANAEAVADISVSQVRNIMASMTDLTAGTSSLTSGNMYLVYE